VDPLLRVLHHVDGPRAHRDMCDALVEILGDDVVDIIDRFDVDNPLIASDAVYIAGRANVTRLTPSMQELVYYPDRKVKEQMIALVSKMEEDSVVDLLLGAMGDTDKHVRCRAMEAAAERRDPRVRERLHELAFGRDFSGFELDEQEVIFRSLGRVGDATTVASIEGMVEKKGLRRLVGNRDEKLLAIRALEGIADPAAGRVLDALSEDSNHLVQSRARRARAARAQAISGGETGGKSNDAGVPS
jgi:HEAT repeat protein